MARTVTIVGTEFPVDVRPGAEITYTDPTQADPFEIHRGTVWDRAPQGPGKDSARYGHLYETPGLWLWVIPEGERRAVRVRVLRDGTTYLDDSPYVVRTTNGLRWSHEWTADRINARINGAA